MSMNSASDLVRSSLSPTGSSHSINSESEEPAPPATLLTHPLNMTSSSGVGSNKGVPPPLRSVPPQSQYRQYYNPNNLPNSGKLKELTIHS